MTKLIPFPDPNSRQSPEQAPLTSVEQREETASSTGEKTLLPEKKLPRILFRLKLQPPVLTEQHYHELEELFGSRRAGPQLVDED